MPTSTYLIALGSNRPGKAGPPRAQLAAALAEVGGVMAASRVHDTPPLGPSIRRFANMAAIVETALPPTDLLHRLKQIERRFGRRRGRRWGARALDIDIILWSGGAWSSPELTIPHPAFRIRDFVLAPACEIAGDWRDPLSGRTLRQLRSRLTRPRPAPRCDRLGAGP
ncbi:2-amino-4-hydroxy-6-hydroxymethyldihydropteridine diphosphokinase [Stakelama tenebrarum]|uniref:2-amino-4-hydroxy-6-hydroxymethyldihydropteridine pyrophosphokinase n=1 Tax=Stakelama tenebrarum TaxID=2711215 RepID=A0A6G6Y915_9SPHN|nr:2-amino-4-hydroxy-6-hydroxymethyldihydropteridine diphosphokinase [Sphingosinithalassobacter tenebrarum]QIG81432.1 2-amino-4-hydroxy-6-hydroxymethyldihydropteridine diphosphokinase [Sphingosinithalassobacter tenebrarum]